MPAPPTLSVLWGMDSLQTTPNTPPQSGPYSALHTGFALLLSALSWAFTLANLQSVLSILLTLTSLVWVVVQIMSHRQARASKASEEPPVRCPYCDAE